MYREGYQQQMLKENEVLGLLKVTGRGIDNTSQYIYDITALDSLKKIYSEATINKQFLEELLKQILFTIEETRKHMLNVNCILLDPEYIFMKGKNIWFCYYPIKQEEINISFQKLTEYIIQNIDYGCMEDIMLACKLHKETLDGSSTIDEIINNNLCLEATINLEEKQEIIKKKEVGREEYNDELKEESLFENIRGKRKEKVGKIDKEKGKKVFWKSKKKSQWGEWDNLINKEEYSIINS